MFSRWSNAGALMVVGLQVACHRAAPAPPPSALFALPDALAGFTGAAPVVGETFVRRRYTRAATRVDVTLARSSLGPDGFAGWLTMSRAGFPQAVLDAPGEDANGFYQCTDGPTPSCDLLIQLRSGVHLELRGGGTSRRADVDELAGALPLRALAAMSADAGGAR